MAWLKLLKTSLRLSIHIVTMAVRRTPTRKAMRTKMTNSVVVKELAQGVETGLVFTRTESVVIFPRLWS